MKQNFVRKIVALNEKILDLETSNKNLKQNYQLVAEERQGLQLSNKELQQLVQNLRSEQARRSNAKVTDLISPEMLSNEDTVTLMVEILKRVLESQDMKAQIQQSTQFVQLTQLVSAGDPSEKQDPLRGVKKQLFGTLNQSKRHYDSLNLFNTSDYQYFNRQFRSTHE